MSVFARHYSSDLQKVSPRSQKNGGSNPRSVLIKTRRFEIALPIPEIQDRNVLRISIHPLPPMADSSEEALVKPSSLLALNAVVISIACAVNAGAKSDAVVASGGSGGGAPAAVKSGSRARRFTLKYEATVKSAPEKTKEVDLWLPVAGDTEFQKVKTTGVTAPASHEINVEPLLGNKVLHVRVPAASLPLTVAVDYEVERTERRTDLAVPAGDAALGAEARAGCLAPTKLVP